MNMRLTQLERLEMKGLLDKRESSELFWMRHGKKFADGMVALFLVSIGLAVGMVAVATKTH